MPESLCMRILFLFPLTNHSSNRNVELAKQRFNLTTGWVPADTPSTKTADKMLPSSRTRSIAPMNSEVENPCCLLELTGQVCAWITRRSSGSTKAANSRLRTAGDYAGKHAGGHDLEEVVCFTTPLHRKDLQQSGRSISWRVWAGNAAQRSDGNKATALWLRSSIVAELPEARARGADEGRQRAKGTRLSSELLELRLSDNRQPITTRLRSLLRR